MTKFYTPSLFLIIVWVLIIGNRLFKVKKPETLERRYLGVLSPTAIDFMKGLLEMDPNKRLNGETVFKHKYFSIFMDNKEEKTKTITNTISLVKIPLNRCFKTI